jgi:hypothetical protein
LQPLRRSAGVVELARLESVYTGNRIKGSNPFSSAFYLLPMRLLTLLALLVAFQQISFAQSISYSIPDGYEKDISKDDYKKLVDLSVSIVARRYTVERVKDGTIQLKKGQELSELNLHNLIGKLAMAKDRSNVNAIIEGHFTNIFSSIDEQKKIDPENFESVRKYLSLRIYPAATIRQRGGTGPVVVKTDLEDTYTLLMLDLPGAFMPVDKNIFRGWKKDSIEVFSIAQQNVNKQEMEKVTRTFDLDSSKIEVNFLGNEDYAASYALDLEKNTPEFVGEWGSVLVMPNKGIVDICKVSKDKPLDFVKFIQAIKPSIDQSFREHPQPISDQFFWYYKGKFTRINVKVEADGNINVFSPAGLTALMLESK